MKLNTVRNYCLYFFYFVKYSPSHKNVKKKNYYTATFTFHIT
jgi:hypothetical protein